MQILRKRILACFMVAFLSLFSVFSSYEDAQASASGVIGGGAVIVGTEYAFAWLLGALGLTAASVAVYENADSIKVWGGKQITEFKNWMEANVDSYNEWADLTSSEVNAWIDKLAKGTLDKASATWRAFRDYVGIQYVPDYFPGENPGSIPGSSSYYFNAISSNGLFFRYEFYSSNYLIVAISSNDIMVVSDSPFLCYLKYSYSDSWLTNTYNSIYPNSNYYYTFGSLNSSTSSFDWSRVLDMSKYGSADVISRLKSGSLSWNGVLSGDKSDYAYVGGISDVFDRDNSFENVDLVGVGVGADAVDIPINWGNVGEESGVLSDVVAGTVPWTDALSSAGVGVVDLSHDTVIGDEGETDEPIAGVVTPPTSTVPTELENYTVSDLSKLFPFCIPFDLIDFIGVLSADPEAPHFTWTFSYPTLDGMQSYDLQIDLSAFDSIAELLRDMECILFIVGLILITRDQMIKG